MKTSVLIIAHNEEVHIEACIRSVLDQTQHPDEVVLVCHNCTDRTESIAREFSEIRVVSYQGPQGVPYARIKGFEEIQGDIVACIDGDSVADRCWLSQVTAPLMRDPGVAIVAGYVVITNNFFSRLTSFWQFVCNRNLFRRKKHLFAWGSNFACRKSDYEKVGGIAPITALKDTLKLYFWAEDFYISVALMQTGKFFCALGAKTYTTLPSWKINPATAPVAQWQSDNQKLLAYFNS